MWEETEADDTSTYKTNTALTHDTVHVLVLIN